MAVSFSSATDRRLWQSGLLGSALWIVIAVAIGHIFGRDGSQWTLAAVVFGVFVAVSIAWWLTRAAVQWLVWRLLWRKASINNLVAAFEKHSFPKPPASLSSPESWFADLAVGSEYGELTMEQRLAAGGHYLRIAEFAQEQGLLAAMRARAMYEEAIAAYRSTFPR